MFDEIVELQHQLTQNKIDSGLEKDRFVARTAKTTQQKKDIERFLRDGFDAREISVLAHVPLAGYSTKYYSRDTKT